MISFARNIILSLHRCITAKIVIAIVGGMAAVGLVQGHLSARAHRQWLADEAREHALILAAAVHVMVSGDPENPDSRPTTTDLTHVLEHVCRLSGAQSVDFVDASGTIVFSSRPGRVGSAVPSASRDDPGLIAVVPLHSDACSDTEPTAFREVSALCFTRSDVLRPAPPGPGYQMLTRSRVAPTVLITFVVLIVVWVVVQWPIAELMRAVTRIERGDLTVRVTTPAGGDEFGRFAAGLNSMLASLRDTSLELRVLHETQMAQADRVASMGQLASGLAHEIKNPLHGISSALTVISDRVDSDTAAIITEIQNQISRVTAILTDMLMYARPRPSRFELCNLADVVNCTLALLRADIESHDIHIETQVAADLPLAHLDRDKMQQVYLNLILNAIQAGGNGNRVRVTLEYDAGINAIVSHVHDSGPGINAESAARIFEPFFTTKRGGHGLGLPTSRMLVEQNHGSLRLLPPDGNGACFEIVLPVFSEPPSAPVQAEVRSGVDTGIGATDTYLFGLACRCPYGNEARCPADEIRRIRQLDLTMRHDAIRSLPGECKRALQEQHVLCSYRCSGQTHGSTPENSPPAKRSALTS